MATTTEIERKYEVPVDFAMPDLTKLRGVATVDDPVELRLKAVYYDTVGLRLARHRITLRRRVGGHDAGWHLKVPAGADRTEIQEPLGNKRQDVPEVLATRVRAISRGEEFGPIARIRTRRLERPVRDADGAVLALLADDVVASEALTEPAVLQRWRELEVELVDGPRSLLADIDAALRDAGARPAASASKLAQAMAELYPAAPSTKPVKDPATRSLGTYLRRQRDAILDTDPGVRSGDAEAVHDMRVASRRLRATTRTFAAVLHPLPPSLRDELRWLSGVLGAVRDNDVMAQRLADAVAAEPLELVVGPVATRIRQRLDADGAPARAALSRALDSPRYVALLDALDALVDAGPPKVTAKSLRRLTRSTLRRADSKLRKALRTPAPDTISSESTRDTMLHDARKAYKQARYAVEVLKPLAGPRAGELARRLTALQDVLGAHQDAAVAGGVLRDHGMRAYLDGENAFTYGLLHARQHAEAQQQLTRLTYARRRAARSSVRSFLH